MYIQSKIGIMIIIVTQTPSKHLSSAYPLESVSMLKIHVLKMLSHMIKKMHRTVVMGDRARVSA